MRSSTVVAKLQVPAGLVYFYETTTLSAAISSPNPIHLSHLEQMRQVIKRGGAAGGVYVGWY